MSTPGESCSHASKKVSSHNSPSATHLDRRNAVAVAFRGRPNTRSFGKPTQGKSTANQGVPLKDGATLVVTVATFQDRRGNVYGGPIIPDEIIEGLFEEERLT
jgi:hypothetical protein